MAFRLVGKDEYGNSMTVVGRSAILAMNKFRYMKLIWFSGRRLSLVEASIDCRFMNRYLLVTGTCAVAVLDEGELAIITPSLACTT